MAQKRNVSKSKSKNMSKTNKGSSSRKHLIKSRKSGTKTRKMSGGAKSSKKTNPHEKMLGTHKEVLEFLGKKSTTNSKGRTRFEKLTESPEYGEILRIKAMPNATHENKNQKLDLARKVLSKSFDSKLKAHAVADYLLHESHNNFNNPITPMTRQHKAPAQTYVNLMPIVDPTYENLLPKWQNRSGNPAIYETYIGLKPFSGDKNIGEVAERQRKHTETVLKRMGLT